jgi:hypothetical protein
MERKHIVSKIGLLVATGGLLAAITACGPNSTTGSTDGGCQSVRDFSTSCTTIPGGGATPDQKSVDGSLRDNEYKEHVEFK